MRATAASTARCTAAMRKALPNACFIGFTGTPVMKKEKDTINKFGGLIEPTYSIRQAVEDKAVVPLLYEGRDVEQRVDRQSIDRWFDVITANLTKEQKADLKKKFTTTDQLNKAEQKVREIALDISLHFRDNWQGTPYKAQLVTQDKVDGPALQEVPRRVRHGLVGGADLRPRRPRRQRGSGRGEPARRAAVLEEDDGQTRQRGAVQQEPHQRLQAAATSRKSSSSWTSC